MRTILRAVALSAALAAAAACITVDVGGKKGETVPGDRFHVLDAADIGARPPAAAAPPAANSRRPVIALRSFRARDRFDKHVLRRDDAGRVTPLDHDLWADEPSQAVTDACREALAACGAYSAAVDTADAHAADVILEGTVLEFSVAMPPAAPEGTGPSKARFRARLTLSDARTGAILVTGSYAGDADLPGPTTDGLGPAMGRAVGQALRSLLADAAR